MNAPSVQGALAQWRRPRPQTQLLVQPGQLDFFAVLRSGAIFGGIQVRKAYAADRVSKLRLKLVPATIFTCAFGKS